MRTAHGGPIASLGDDVAPASVQSTQSAAVDARLFACSGRPRRPTTNASYFANNCGIQVGDDVLPTGSTFAAGANGDSLLKRHCMLMQTSLSKSLQPWRVLASTRRDVVSTEKPGISLGRIADLASPQRCSIVRKGSSRPYSIQQANAARDTTVSVIGSPDGRPQDHKDHS